MGEQWEVLPSAIRDQGVGKAVFRNVMLKTSGYEHAAGSRAKENSCRRSTASCPMPSKRDQSLAVNIRNLLAKVISISFRKQL